MVKIRLKRMGASKSPFYRIVVTDSRNRRDGREIEVLGTIDPKVSPALVKIDEEKVLKWLNNGAKPSDTMRNYLSDLGIMKKYADNKKAK